MLHISMIRAKSVSVVALLLSTSLLSACNEQRDTVVLADEQPYREGDLVMRCGYGAESRMVTQASQSIYSHIGILHRDTLHARWTVIHAVPGEAAEGEAELLKCEPLSAFYAPDRAFRGAWMRVNCPDSIAAAAAQYALRKVTEKVLFDNDYLLSDTTQIYCTELVWQAYLHQGIDLSDQHRHPVPSLISKDRECIFPCDIEKSSKIIYFNPLKTQKQ